MIINSIDCMSYDDKGMVCDGVKSGIYAEEFGHHSGLWFFGDKFNELKNETFDTLTIHMKRIHGGFKCPAKLQLKCHGYENKPSMTPMLYDWEIDFAAPHEEDIVITITDTNILNDIKNGNIKGFGVTSDMSKDNYVRLSSLITVVSSETYKIRVNIDLENKDEIRKLIQEEVKTSMSEIETRVTDIQAQLCSLVTLSKDSIKIKFNE